MPSPARSGNARSMDHASARTRLVGTLAGRMRGRDIEATYASAITQIETLHASPELSDRQARVGTLVVLDALAEALAGEEPRP